MEVPTVLCSCRSCASIVRVGLPTTTRALEIENGTCLSRKDIGWNVSGLKYGMDEDERL